jgi:acid phosphatase
MRRAAALLAALTLTAGLAACSADEEPSRFANVDEPTPSVGPTDVPTVKPSKIAVIIGENKGYSQVIKGAPWMKSIGEKYGLAKSMKAMTHPSQPNYVWIAAGENKGITSNTIKHVTGPSIMGKTIAAGRTAMVFAQTMSSDNCRQTQRGYYHPRHSYWVPFKDERALCEKFMVGYDKIVPRITAGTLPNLTLIVPNNCKNSHDCSLRTADAWFRAETERLMAGPDYQSGELAIVLTWDEDNHQEGNHIHTVLIHPSIDRKVVTAPLTLVSLHRTLARFGGVTPLGIRWKTTTDLATAFGLSID